jgi:hypothetical protein
VVPSVIKHARTDRLLAIYRHNHRRRAISILRNRDALIRQSFTVNQLPLFPTQEGGEGRGEEAFAYIAYFAVIRAGPVSHFAPSAVKSVHGRKAEGRQENGLANL